MAPKNKNTMDAEFRALLEETLSTGPYANDKHLHALWCTGFLKELLLYIGNRHEVRKHLMNIRDRNIENQSSGTFESVLDSLA